jgi:type I restriction enzyme S subunit
MSEFPDDWVEISLGEAFSVKRGDSSLTKSAYRSTGTLAFSASGPDGFVEECQNDGAGIVVSSVGAQCGKIFKASGKWTAINNTIAITEKIDVFSIDYLYCLLERQDILLPEGGAQPFISQKEVVGATLCFPPLPEQKKIAEILSGIDQMINGISEAIEKSEIILTGIFTELDLIASSGKTTNLGEVAGVQNGYAFQSSVFTEDPLGIPLIRISNISGGIVDASKSKKIPRTQVPSDEYKVTKGDILIAMSGATTGKIGRYQGDTFCLLNQRVGKFVFRPGGSGAVYVSQLLLSGFLESRILAKAAGGAQPNISGKGIEDIEIPFPDAAERSRYGNTIHKLLQVNSARKDLIEKYQHLKSAISTDLLSGRKRVSV